MNAIILHSVASTVTENPSLNLVYGLTLLCLAFWYFARSQHTKDKKYKN